MAADGVTQAEAIYLALKAGSHSELGDVHVWGPPEGPMHTRGRFCNEPTREECDVVYHREVRLTPTGECSCLVCGATDAEAEG